jgi:putative endonuclease
MTTQRRAIGAYGELRAARYLQERGLKVLARNWRCADGELDLILRDGDAVVFCEVKTRRTATFGPPAAAVDPRKVHKLRQLAVRWLAESGTRAPQIRFDVVEVLPQPRGATRVVHIRAAF